MWSTYKCLHNGGFTQNLKKTITISIKTRASWIHVIFTVMFATESMNSRFRNIIRGFVIKLLPEVYFSKNSIINMLTIGSKT